MTGNATVVNFSGGETSPRSRGRFDQPWYQTSARKMLNFIAEVQGPARFRPGTVFSYQTRLGAVARLIDFEVSDIVTYLLEFTPGYLRVRNPLTYQLLTAGAATITGITLASTAVVTVAAATSLSNGKEVVLSAMAGMPQLNNKQFLVANLSGTTFNLADPVTGALLNTSSYPAAATGGTASVVYEATTPYSALDLQSLQVAAADGTMYLTTGTQPANKMTLDSSGAFTIGTYTRTNDPFTAGAAIDLVSTSAYGIMRSTKMDAFLSNGAGGIVNAGYTVVIFPAGTVVIPGAIYTFASVMGSTEVNGNTYTLVPMATNDANWNAAFSEWGNPVNAVLCLLQTTAGANIDSSAWTAYTSGGAATPAAEYPIGVAFYEGRLIFAGTNARPDCLFLSQSPDPTTGDSQYDVFTGGSDDNDACFFQLAPTGGSTAFISWARGGPDYLFVGTFGGPYRVSGSGLDIPITPSSINVRQFDTAGAEQTASAGLAQMFFVQRSGATVRSIKVINPYLATFESADMCLNAEQVGYPPIQRIALSRGRPDTLWGFCENGQLIGMSVHITAQNADTLTGWHRHQIGGNGVVVDIAITERQTGYDQLWGCVQRTVNGASRCYVEVLADDVTFPDPEDFYGTSGPIVTPSDDPSNDVSQESGFGSQAADLKNWQNAVWRLQANYVHMDSEVSYDGSLRGVAAGATLTPSAVGVPQVEGQAPTTITLTASEAVFTAADVNSEIWIKPDLVTGQGGGRALITAYTDTEHVTATVSVPFSSTTAFAAGDWFFAVSTFYGFGHLEGEEVAVVADGAVVSDGGQTGDADFPTITVTLGTIALPSGDFGQPMRAAVLRAGFPYTGILETHNLEMGGRSGPAQSKPRNISEINIRFMNTLGAEYGTSLYAMQKINHRLSDAIADRPAPVFSGIRRVKLEDSWSGLNDATREKNVFITQRLPLPAVVQFLDLDYATTDDGGDD